MRYRTRSLIAGLLAMVFVTVAAGPLAAAPAPGTSNVRIVHGLPLDDSGTLVDVYLEAGGAPLSGPPELSSFAFRQATRPLAIPAGDYTVYIALAGTTTVAIEQDLAVPAGLDLSAVASFVPDGAGGFDPGINVFVDDLKASTSDGRISIRHAAAFGDVDAVATDRFGTLGPVPVNGLGNGEQVDLDVPKSRYRAVVYPAGTTTVAGQFENGQVQRNKLTTMYAVGDPSAGTFQFMRILPTLSLSTMSPT